MLRLDVEILFLGTAICRSLNSGPNLGNPQNGETVRLSIQKYQRGQVIPPN